MNPVDHIQTADSQQQAETPTFWVLLAAISVLLHLVLLVAVNLFLARNTRVQLAAEPISIELVQPSDSTQSGSTQINPPAAGQAIAPQAVVPTSPQAVPPAAQAPTATPLNPQLPAPVEPRIAQPIPNPQLPVPVPQSVPTPLPGNVPLPQPAPTQSVPPANPVPSPIPSSIPSPIPPPISPPSNPFPADGTSPAGNPLPAPSVPSQSGALPPSNGDRSGGNGPEDSPLPSVPISDSRGEGSGLKASVSSIVPTDPSRDVTDPGAYAQPTITSEPFPDLTYPAAVGLNLGQPVKLRLIVDNAGKVEQAIVLEGSASSDYDALAKDLITRIRFTPARQGGQPVVNRVDVTLKLEPLR